MSITPEEQAAIDRLEENFLNWIRNASIFFITGVALLSFEKGQRVAYWVLMVSIVLLVITELDYVTERQLLVDRGFAVPYRLDWLWFITIFAIGLIVWLLYEFFP